jgi:hypothetical protein
LLQVHFRPVSDSLLLTHSTSLLTVSITSWITKLYFPHPVTFITILNCVIDIIIVIKKQIILDTGKCLELSKIQNFWTTLAHVQRNAMINVQNKSHTQCSISLTGIDLP